MANSNSAKKPQQTNPIWGQEELDMTEKLNINLSKVAVKEHLI